MELVTRISDGLSTRRAAIAPVTFRTALARTGRVSIICLLLAPYPSPPLRLRHWPPLQNPRGRRSQWLPSPSPGWIVSSLQFFKRENNFPLRIKTSSSFTCFYWISLNSCGFYNFTFVLKQQVSQHGTAKKKTKIQIRLLHCIIDDPWFKVESSEVRLEMRITI